MRNPATARSEPGAGYADPESGSFEHSGRAQRTFVFGSGAVTDAPTIPCHQHSSAVRGASTTDGGRVLTADFGRVSAAPQFGTREVWTLVNGGGGWDHPIHIHFEEGQILARNGSASKFRHGNRAAKTSIVCVPAEA